MKNFLGWLQKYWVVLLIILAIAVLVALDIWQVIVQIRYDGQYISWRWIPLWLKVR